MTDILPLHQRSWRAQRDEKPMPKDAVFQSICDPDVFHLDPPPHPLRTPEMWSVLDGPAMSIADIVDNSTRTVCPHCMAALRTAIPHVVEQLHHDLPVAIETLERLEAAYELLEYLGYEGAPDTSDGANMDRYYGWGDAIPFLKEDLESMRAEPGVDDGKGTDS